MFKIARHVFQSKFEFDVCKRFAGHSKWQNIKHIKAEKDGERSALFTQLCNKMKIAIAEGGSAWPEKNMKLEKAVEQCKKANMPNDTIGSFLKKAQSSKDVSQVFLMVLRAPGRSFFLLQLLTDNIRRTTISINTICRKCSCKICDPLPKGIFIPKGIILTTVTKNVDAAMEDAIMSGSEEVEEIEENGQKYFQFTCDVSTLLAVRKELENLNYDILSVDEEYIPTTHVEIENEQDESLIDKLYIKLGEIPEIHKVYTNIA